jgi:hypothetical protein
MFFQLQSTSIQSLDHGFRAMEQDMSGCRDGSVIDVILRLKSEGPRHRFRVPTSGRH